MLPCPTPDTLFATCLELASNGAHGVLLSGGYNSEGYVPFEPFLDAIERVKRETGLFISAHTGLMPRWLIHELARVGLDAAFFDVVGSNETIELVFGVERKITEYKRTLNMLRREVRWIAPHVCIGLHKGKIVGEFEALEMVSAVGIDVLVFLVFVPTAGTAFENVQAPDPSAVSEVISKAREMFPTVPLTLGCMRPRGAERIELELAALKAGVNRMEIPHEQTLGVARSMGLIVKRLDACCAVPDTIAVDRFVDNERLV